jgi:hypothetical protein
MKVICTELGDTEGDTPSRSPWLTVGKEYTVLSVYFDVHGRWLLLLMGDNEPGLGLFPFCHFSVVDSSLPSNWVALWHTDGTFELTPVPWAKSGYWERYFDGDPESVSLFDEERRKIVQ